MASWTATFGENATNDQRDGLGVRRIGGVDAVDPRQEFRTANADAPIQQTFDYQLHHPEYPGSAAPPDVAVVYPASLRTVRSPAPPISTTSDNLGRFIHSQCEQELFNNEYLRSNKASGHKNLRCFPHCCGGHNPKSFCGSGLIVECSLPHAQIALGRFEEVVKSPLVLSSRAADALSNNADYYNANDSGNHKMGTNTNISDANVSDMDTKPVLDHIHVHQWYSRRDLMHGLKSSENPFGMWFKGVTVLNNQSQSHGPRFHVNGNRQSWHYGWQSSRLNCKNLHVFKVYFFTANNANNANDSNDANANDLVECVATVSSPPFRISSSRKARKTFKSSPSLQSLGSVSDDQLSIPQSSPRLATTTAMEDDDRLSIDSFDSSDSGALQPQAQQFMAPPTLASLQQHHHHHHVAHSSGCTSTSRRSFDFSPIQRGSSDTTSGDVLPSLRSRLTRASSITADVAFAQHHHQPHQFQQLPHQNQQHQHQHQHQQQNQQYQHQHHQHQHHPRQHHHQHQQLYHQSYRGQPERKRLIRSASLQSDYFSSIASFSRVTTPQTLIPTREPRAQTCPGQEPTGMGMGVVTGTGTVTVTSRSCMLRMDSLLNAQDPGAADGDQDQDKNQDDNQATHDVSRPWLPAMATSIAIAVPPQPASSLGPFNVTTPVADMMQLRLETPRVVTRTSSALSLSAMLSSEKLQWPTATTTATAMAAEEATPTPTSTPQPTRKRNRSTDSLGKWATDGSHTTAWHDGPLLNEIAPHGDWGLTAQAHALGVVIAIASRLERVGKRDESPSVSSPSVYEILSTSGHGRATVGVETKPALARLCGILIDAASQLIHQTTFLADVRGKIHDLVRGSRSSESVGHFYAAMLAFGLPFVEQQLARAMAAASDSGCSSTSLTSPSPFVELLRSAEHELIAEPWWREVTLFDHHSDTYPFMEFASSYVAAVRASQLYQEPQLSSGGRGPLTGEWRSLHSSSILNDGDSSAGTAAMAMAMASNWPTATGWLQRQLELYESQVYHLIETADSLTLTLGNSFVSPACPFVAELGQREPQTTIPVDHFPYALTRRHLLLAYRAWRDSSSSDTTSTIVVQSMQWPTQADLRVLPMDQASAMPLPAATQMHQQLLRKRVTTSFTLVSPTRLQVRSVVEGSVTQDVALCNLAGTPPSDGAMVEYFTAPAAQWHVITQHTLEYERTV